MLQLEIITNEKELRKIAKRVSKWAGLRVGTKLIKFIAWNNMDCVGLSAIQVGINARVFVLYDGNNFAVFVNPRILEASVVEDEQVESCLSIPGKSYKVRRPISIVVKDAIRTKPFEIDGMTARAYQHELDHLNGKLISDRGVLVEVPK